ncbi:hypothetical protein JW851_00070 [Candidatus Woesearchaeota archaeon]|nr:hypothetical protein [Candidatus Woesearchaeota archaeon]
MEISNKTLLVLVLIAIIVSLTGTWLSLSKLQTITGKVTLSQQEQTQFHKEAGAQTDCEKCLTLCKQSTS